MATDPTTIPCAAGTLRRAARSIARVYDTHLAKAGLTTTQFSILRALERRGAPVPLSSLAEELVFERTSLYRALQPLQRARLISFATRGARGAKTIALEAEGRRRIARAQKYWIDAQSAFMARFGERAWKAMSAQLGDIVAVAREMPVR